MVASMVLSPSSARKNATEAATTAERTDRLARPASSLLSVSPRRGPHREPEERESSDDLALVAQLGHEDDAEAQ